MDAERVRALGPWILVKPEGAVKITPGGIHVPGEVGMAKVGYNIARVKSVGSGYWTEKGLRGETRQRFVRPQVKVGDRVAYRTHLNNSCKFGDHSFIHMDDLELKVDEGTVLNLAAPYDN